MKILLTILSSTLVITAGIVRAQELTPRAYWPAPLGTQVATVGFSHVSGDIIPDPSLPITGVDSDINTLSLGYLRTLSLWGRTANIIVEVPVSDGDTTGTGDFGERLERQYEGVGDISTTLSVNFLGAPSMNPQEFAELRQNPRPILGGSLKLVAPTGKYDSDRVINVGANRWAVKAELGYMTPISPRWLLELDLGAWIFEDNDDFLGFTKEQASVVAAQAHLIHRFGPGFWASLDASFYKGGRSTVDGRRLDDLQRDSKLGLTVVYPFAHKQVIKLGYSIGSVNDSDENFDIFLLAYSRLF